MPEVEVEHVTVNHEITTQSTEHVEVGEGIPAQIVVSETGLVGPPGIQGPVGPTGPTGPTGPHGLGNVTTFSGDLDTLNTPGIYEIFSGTNLPTSGFTGTIIVTKGQFFVTQTAYANGIIYTRSGLMSIAGNSWSSTVLAESVRGGAIVGTGSPEGVRAASIGQRYIDTAATNGAVEWIKTGTGNTGWKVTHGDTGWRNVGANLESGWLVGAFLMRRINNEVYFSYSNLRHSVAQGATWNKVYTVPAGFKGSQSGWILSVGSNLPVQTAYSTDFHVLGGNTTGNYGSVSHVTDQVWPTTLPGTAA